MTWLDTLRSLIRDPGTPRDAIADDPGPTQAILEAEDLAQEDRLWRSVSTTGTMEPAWHELQRQMLDAAEAYRANPLAFRIVELTVDHVLGKGVKLRARDKDLQIWLDEWWSHPQNRMATRVFDLCRELSICGEIFVTFHPDPLKGMTYIRQIPPPNVDEVETDPNDVETELRCHESGNTSAPMGRWWPAMPDPASPLRSQDSALGTSYCAHYAINRLAGCVRGQGDLAPILPWLRRYKDWLTDRVRINKFKGAFLWWVKLAGADRATVEQKRAELLKPPSPGSVIVTNDAEEWTAVQPQIDAQAVEPDGRAMRIMLAAGAGIPLHFLAEPEHTNRATAAEMHGPTLRHFENRQQHFGWILADIARRAAVLSGRFAEREVAIAAVFEDLTTVDNLKVAQAAAAMVNALAVARDRGWITDRTAEETLSSYIGLKQEAEA